MSGKIVSIHSFRGGTGKSNIAANLAAAAALDGKRVAVMDTDMANPDQDQADDQWGEDDKRHRPIKRFAEWFSHNGARVVCRSPRCDDVPAKLACSAGCFSQTQYYYCCSSSSMRTALYKLRHMHTIALAQILT